MAHVQTQTEWEQEMAEEVLRFVRQELFVSLRYLEPALFALSYRRYGGLLTFATDGTDLLFSAEATLRIFQKNSAFLDRVYLHTVCHCLFRHLWLRGGRKERIWNLACDIAVEYTIDALDADCTRRAIGFVRKEYYAMLDETAQGRSAAVIYRLLMECGDDALAELEREFFTDDHRFWPKEADMERPSVKMAGQNWQKAARQISLLQDRKKMDAGEGAANFAAQIKAGESRRSYQAFLKKFAMPVEEPRLNPDEFDLGYYAYGLRLYRNLPLIEPLETRETHKIREFVIVLDTSDSTSGALIAGFLKETYAILTQKNSFAAQSQIRILQCDEKVRKETLVKGEDAFLRLLSEFELVGGGGTDFRPAFSYVEERMAQGKCRQPDGLLYFTDGRGIYPQKKPAYPVAFLFLDAYEDMAVPSWAMRHRLESEDMLYEYQTGKRRTETYDTRVSGEGCVGGV